MINISNVYVIMTLVSVELVYNGRVKLFIEIMPVCLRVRSGF